MHNHAVSTYFISPIVEIRKNEPVNVFDKTYFTDSYLGDHLREEYRNWKEGKYFLMEYNDLIPQNVREHLKANPNFKEEYSPQDGRNMFVFTIPTEYVESYVLKVIDGKYSEASKEVVNKYFPDNLSHPRYGNRLVFLKSEQWKEKWERELGVVLPDGAEVYSKPFPRNEVYGYYLEPVKEVTEQTTFDLDLSSEDYKLESI